MEETSLKRVYTEFYHQLVDAVSDPHTCQSLTAQLHPTTLISQEKIDQLSSGQHTGGSFLKVLGVEKDPQLLTVLMEKMANVEQLQALWKSMSTWQSTMKQGNLNRTVCKYGTCILCVLHIPVYMRESMSLCVKGWCYHIVHVCRCSVL